MNINIQQNTLLSKYTQLKIGGPAEYFFIAKSKNELIEAIEWGRSKEIEVTIIGWGSNILVSDKGIKGLTIINKSSEIKILDDINPSSSVRIVEGEESDIARLDQIESSKYGDFSDLDYDESNLPSTKVYMDSGVSLPLAIYKTIKAGLTGLQWFAGIPGTIGGSVYNNIHGGTHFLFEFISEVEVLDKQTLETKILKVADLEGGYDKSIFHQTNDYIISATFNLFHGDSEKAMNVMQEWRMRKKIQPQISAGCMWKNISKEQMEKLNLPTSSVGYIVDKILNLKGEKQGGAIISDAHAAFIENTNNAKASDVLYLMKKIHNEAKEKLSLNLSPEIFLLGFDNEEIKEFK